MSLRVALAQIDPTIGDFAGNSRLVEESFAKARTRGAELVLFPELCIPGYPPKDLVEREACVRANTEALETLAPKLRDAMTVVGVIDRAKQAPLVGRALWNAAAVIDDGRIVSIHHKALLPTYDVFDEGRWFQPAVNVVVATAGGRKLGVSICEDVWNDPDFWPHRLYPKDPIAELVA